MKEHHIHGVSCPHNSELSAEPPKASMRQTARCDCYLAASTCQHGRKKKRNIHARCQRHGLTRPKAKLKSSRESKSDRGKQLLFPASEANPKPTPVHPERMWRLDCPHPRAAAARRAARPPAPMPIKQRRWCPPLLGMGQNSTTRAPQV